MFVNIILSFLLGAVSADDQGKVLILGGQGLAGSATFTSLLDASYHVTLLNNNKNYYDYQTLLQTDNTDTVVCNRPAPLSGCFELQNFISRTSKVRAVVDFTSSNGELMADSVAALGPLEPEVYIFVSSAAVYDVSADPVAPVKEEEARRNEDEATREANSLNNEFGDKMLAAEEVLVASGIPYVILRCGDLVGPRDTTYRWWQYQVWAEHFTLIGAPFPIPNDLYDTQFSLTFGADVGQAVVNTLRLGRINKVYNIAMDKRFTLPHLLLEICIHFGRGEDCYADYTDDVDTPTFYPSNHVGIMSLEAATEELEFVPSKWEDVLKSTIEFYEGARSEFAKERDVVLKKLNEKVVPYLRVADLNNVVTNTEQRVVEEVTRTEL